MAVSTQFIREEMVHFVDYTPTLEQPLKRGRVVFAHVKYNSSEEADLADGYFFSGSVVFEYAKGTLKIGGGVPFYKDVMGCHVKSEYPSEEVVMFSAEDEAALVKIVVAHLPAMWRAIGRERGQEAE